MIEDSPTSKQLVALHPPDTHSPPKRSAVRWQMMALVTATTILTYLDRLNLSIAGHFIQDEFSFSIKTMGWILSSFLVAYSIAIIRCLIGIGEAPSSPSYTKVVANWIGHTRRGFGSSFNLFGIGLGGALTPVLITFIMRHWGWRTAFYCCGLLGFLMALIWYLWATDRPEQHPRVNQAEIDFIRAGHPARADGLAKVTVPWKRILTNRSVIALVLGYFCQGFPIYFFHTWLFIYLVKVRSFSLIEGGFYGAAPYIAIAVASPLGGLFSDFAVRVFDKPWGQRL